MSEDLFKKVESIRQQFPMLTNPVNGKPYLYLDNAATTLKPHRVIDRLFKFYSQEYATVHRGVYALSQEATSLFDAVRESTKLFLNARSANEIVFTRGTTEAINLVAHGLGKSGIKPGKEILISEMEHHANFVPWQQLCLEHHLQLKVVPLLDDGQLDMDAYKMKLSEDTFFVAIAHVSNALGTINPIKEIIDLAHQVGARVLIDGAQAAPHMNVDVQELDCDFYAFSSHKLFGPTGVGVLYGREEFLEDMPPYQTGGAMIEKVTIEKTTFAKPPMKFEAGTPAIAEVIGFGEALQFVQDIGRDFISEVESILLQQATSKLSQIPGLRLIGTAPNKASVISFVLDNIHPHDAGTILDEYGIAVRVGHHCAQPVMRRFEVAATIRSSFSVYNMPHEIDELVSGIQHVKRVMGES